MDKQMEQELIARFGFAPGFYETLPPVSRKQEWGIQRDFELSETALPGKTKELIGLAVAAHIKCRYCVYFHAQAARAFGATDDELREACFMAGFTAQMSNALTGMQYDLDRFKGEVDKAFQFMRSQGQQPSPGHRH
jgi:AhpD family alkylhydroperoxidase